MKRRLQAGSTGAASRGASLKRKALETEAGD
jgi:hypothetical protein